MRCGGSREARCIGQDPELFFPVGTTPPALAQVSAAKAVCCGAAPCAADCLEWALVTCQDAGVWGGLDEEERRVDPTRPPTDAAAAAEPRELIAV